jgi:hypothetical protein
LTAHHRPDKGMDSADPVLIPIQRREPHREHDDEEWAMVEINGELLGPSSVQVDDTDSDTNHATLFDTKTRMELGSITFADKEVWQWRIVDCPYVDKDLSHSRFVFRIDALLLYPIDSSYDRWNARVAWQCGEVGPAFCGFAKVRGYSLRHRYIDSECYY